VVQNDRAGQFIHEGLGNLDARVVKNHFSAASFAPIPCQVC
jgi:hypothetical protein